jgi:geranylgeranyl pyrophosphate synthase
MQQLSLVGTMETKTVTFFDLIRDGLSEVEACMRSSPDGHHRNLSNAINHLLSSGGKRIRPTIVLLTGAMLHADHDRLVTLGAAIEMLHTATLVHDDLIDGSKLRRGFPTLNAKWTAGATVLTGDYIFARAADLAARVQSMELVTRFSGSLMTIVNGEITQLFHTPSENPREDYFRRIHAKTATLFEMAAEGPAMLADLQADKRQALREYGRNVGLAFQIVDDVLDFVADQERVGKPTASDLRQGLITLPTICYLETNKQDENLSTLMNTGSLAEEPLDRLIETISSSGAIEQALGEARELTQAAITKLSPFPSSVERQGLIELAEFVTNRNL